jgi:hypothetical protein
LLHAGQARGLGALPQRAEAIVQQKVLRFH